MAAPGVCSGGPLFLMNSETRRFSSLDVLAIALVVGLLGYIGYRLFFALNYKWNWGIIPTYMIRFDEGGHWHANVLLEGFLTTLKLSIWGMVLATFAGVVMGLMRVAGRLLPRLVGLSYVELIRNTPPLVLVFIFYYFVSDQLLPHFGIEDFYRNASPALQKQLAYISASPELITPFLSGVLTIGLFQGAYITEIVRAGIQAIDIGQWEASSALGLNRFQQMRHIILPQSIRIMLRPLANEFINTIKYSSIVSIISIQELTFQGMQVMASTQATIEIWLTITAMYLLVCLVLSLMVGQLEQRLNNHAR
ncbi:amino acid ABC transporter membrane protein 2, PAAT family [Desulfopila aestuarii DSM 18488]|uniref:Amino acid ABC transporter membrane protein 2, PAAT family n=2 Tax=Desulfopila aestuarii TaxID=231440 RepID=A0A1M7Y6X9_9BACT|nr:amino acid ABC transporter membrane protein 2, PAAT family [Desulfopila aestuarii DSM 18488]